MIEVKQHGQTVLSAVFIDGVRVGFAGPEAGASFAATTPYLTDEQKSLVRKALDERDGTASADRKISEPPIIQEDAGDE